jgi:hypothetical protein
MVVDIENEAEGLQENMFFNVILYPETLNLKLPAML